MDGWKKKLGEGPGGAVAWLISSGSFDDGKLGLKPKCEHGMVGSGEKWSDEWWGWIWGNAVIIGAVAKMKRVISCIIALQEERWSWKMRVCCRTVSYSQLSWLESSRTVSWSLEIVGWYSDKRRQGGGPHKPFWHRILKHAQEAQSAGSGTAYCL